MHTTEHLLKLREIMACVYVHMRVCVGSGETGAWLCSQHLLRAREIVSECHIKIT